MGELFISCWLPRRGHGVECAGHSHSDSPTPGTPGLYTNEQQAAWRTVTEAVHANGGRIFAQIVHGGRVSRPDTTGLQPVGPSAVAVVGEVFTPTGPQPAPIPRVLATSEGATTGISHTRHTG